MSLNDFSMPLEVTSLIG